MKTAIVFYSRHHGNTKKLLDAIAEKYPVTLIDATKNPSPDLSGYDAIGFASGIQAEILGRYECFGFNTFGPFKLIGGIAKGHPDSNEISGAVKFYKQLSK